MSLSYAISSRIVALRVDVSTELVTVWADAHMTSAFTKLQLDHIIGTHGHKDFLWKVCRKDVAQVLPKACDFFAPSHLGLVCNSLASLLWERVEIRNFNYSLVDAALEREYDPFMLRPRVGIAYTSTGEALHLFQTARTSPCSSSGLQLRYFHNGSTPALQNAQIMK
jgi:hypothetical protein